jgi:acyl carrier protein
MTQQPDTTGSRLLKWVQANAQSDPSAIDQRTRLLGPGSVLDSLGLVALTVLIEDLRGAPIDPGDFADLDRFASVENIMRAYFDGVAHDPP